MGQAPDDSASSDVGYFLRTRRRSTLVVQGTQRSLYWTGWCPRALLFRERISRRWSWEPRAKLNIQVNNSVHGTTQIACKRYIDVCIWLEPFYVGYG